MNFIIISFAQMIKFYCNDHVSSHQKLVSLLLFNGPSLLSFELHILSQLIQSFHGSSAGKESACSAGDPGLIPGLRRYPEEVIGYPLQYSWASLVAQMVKGKESACRAGDLGSIPRLGRSPERGHSNILQYSCLENPHEQRSLAGYNPWGRKESDTTEWLAQHNNSNSSFNASN